MKDENIQEDKLEKVDKLKKIAENLGATLPQLAIAWAAKNPHVSVVLLGATKETQVHNPSALNAMALIHATILCQEIGHDRSIL